MTICHWHRGQCKQWEQCMSQNESAERGSKTPPAFCSLTYALASSYKYIHKALLPWQRVFSYLGMVPFPCRNSSLKRVPALPCCSCSCQPVSVDWFPSLAVNGEGLCLLAFFTLIQPTEEVGWSQQWSSLDAALPLINLEAIVFAFACTLLMVKCMWLLLAAVVSSLSSGLWRRLT